MLVSNSRLIERFFVLRLINLFEEVFESTVVRLENSVFGTEVNGVIPSETILKRGACKIANRIIEVIHRHCHTGAWIIKDLKLHRLCPIFGSPREREFTFSWNEHISSAILIAERVTADNDRLGPARNQTRNVADHNWFTENNSAENIAHGAVGRLPHLLEAKLFYASFVGRDSCALNRNAMLFRCIG